MLLGLLVGLILVSVSDKEEMDFRYGIDDGDDDALDDVSVVPLPVRRLVMFVINESRESLLLFILLNNHTF